MNLLFINLLVSQNLFASTYGGTGSEHANSIIQTFDGDYVIVSETPSFGAGGYDFLVFKMDLSGNLEWSRTFGGTESEGAHSIIQTSDGGYAIARETGSFGAGGDDVLVLKINPSGDLEWARTFGMTGTEEAQSIIQTSDGGFAIAGKIYGFGAGADDILVLKLTASGDLEWTKAFGTSIVEQAVSIIQESDGGYVIGGGITDMKALLSDPLALKIDSSGNLIWARTYEGFWYDPTLSMTRAADRDYAIAGISDSYGFNNDILVVKISSSGNLEWARVYGDINDQGAYSIAPTSDSGFIIGGYEWIIGTQIIHALVVKTDPSGRVSWARRFGDTSFVYSVTQAIDGGYALAGTTRDYGAGELDCLVMKLDTAGNYPDCVEPCMPPSMGVSPVVTTPSMVVTDCSLAVDTPDLTITIPELTIIDVCSLVMAEEADATPSGSLTLLPAPGGFWITGYSGQARIYDPAGRLVLSREIKGKTLISPLRPGVYFVMAGEERARVAVR